jgi:lipid-binding SYLF domain-containing protein
MRILMILLTPALCLAINPEAAKRLEAASEALSEVMAAPDKGIPAELMSKATCAVIVPGLKKGAFIVGGKFGRGFLSCRTSGGWSAPGAVRVEGGSVGFQIGGSETDVVMLVMNDRGKRSLLSSKFTLGGDASVAAGPVGRSSQAETDAAMRAEILTWSRSRGLFAGVSLSGATLREDEEANQQMYGKKMKNEEVIKSAKAPAEARALLNALAKYSK